MELNNGLEKIGKIKNRKIRNFIFSSFLFTAFIIVLINITIALTPATTFCRLCHNSEYKTLNKTVHRNTGCNSCHNRSDLFSYVGYRIKVIRMAGNFLPYYFFNKPVRSDVSNSSCLECHLKVNDIKVSHRIRMSHKEPLEKGYKCTFCHSKIVHAELVSSPREVDMNKCFTCHNNLKALAQCDTCHPNDKNLMKRYKKGPWQTTHGKKWRNLHGMGDFEACSLCHKSNFCSKCHGINLPHPETWLTIHGPIAKGRQNLCLSCHKKQLCNNCHKVPIPHTAEYLPVHMNYVKKFGKKKCLTCHLQDGCDRCHSLHRHPGLPYDWVKKLREKAGLK